MRLQELSFDVNARGLNIINPSQDLKILVKQNFRWDNAVMMDQPRLQRQEVYEYYINLIESFSGGNEFRWHDVRSTRFYSESMREVTEQPQSYEVTLYQDEVRLKNTFATSALRDRNGGFFINVQEHPQSPDISSDYVMNRFRLRTKYRPEGEVYVFGAFSDWKAKPEYRMDYIESQGRYEADVLLKQGVYDYQYAIQTHDKEQLDEHSLEGNAIENENYYNILVYYRGPNRSDRSYNRFFTCQLF